MEGLQSPTQMSSTHELSAEFVAAEPVEVVAEADAVDSMEDTTPAADAADIDASSTDPFGPLRLVEAVLFSSDAPLTASKIAGLIEELTPAGVKACVEALNEEYEATGRTFRIAHIARGYQMLSMPEYQPWLAKATQQRGDSRLTAAAMETLAVIAYRQPAMRADIEAVRGVACGDQINRLREVGLVKIVGHAEVVGRPMLYGTTRKFLDVFGLGDLRDLPPMEEFGIAPVIVSKPVDEVEPVTPPLEDAEVPERLKASA